MAVFVLSIVGLGLAISAYSKTMQQGLLIAFVTLVPMVLLSGLFTPVDNMPDWIQAITWADPLRFALLSVRRIYLADASWAHIAYTMIPTAAVAAVSLPLCIPLLQKTTMRKKTAKARTDGQATRQALVDAAGILAARHGWASVRAKDVCKLAGVSAASVNYWFGSRDELYREVVRQIPEGLIDGKLEEYFQSNAEPLEKVRRVLETFLMAPRGRGQWHLALWAREVFTGPSEEFIRVVRASGTKHVMSIRRIIAAYLGIPDEGPEIETIVMAVMSPCLLVVASSPEVIKETYPNLMDAKGKEVAVEQLLSILADAQAKAQGRNVVSGVLVFKKIFVFSSSSASNLRLAAANTSKAHDIRLLHRKKADRRECHRDDALRTSTWV